MIEQASEDDSLLDGWRWYDNLAHAASKPAYSAQIKTLPEDFVVDEELGFELSSEGEHVCLNIQKTSVTTQEVANLIASLAKVRLRDVSYSGMKDKHGVCTQWFSVYLPTHHKVEYDWYALEKISLKAGQSLRLNRKDIHNRKLKRGVHRSNRFKIRLKNIVCVDEGKQKPFMANTIIERLQSLSASGFPNYYGYQRFGARMDNVAQATRWLERDSRVSRNKRSIYLSSIGSFLFNELLSERVNAGTWNSFISGDRVQLAGSNSFFRPEDRAEAEANENDKHTIARRLEENDIHIGGLLAGSDFDTVSHDLEKQSLAKHFDLLSLLGKHSNKSSVRALRAIPENLSCRQDESDLIVEFGLNRGVFATSLLREAVQLQDANVRRQA